MGSQGTFDVEGDLRDSRLKDLPGLGELNNGVDERFLNRSIVVREVERSKEALVALIDVLDDVRGMSNDIVGLEDGVVVVIKDVEEDRAALEET